MLERSAKVLAAWSVVRAILTAIWAGLRAVIGPDELGLLIALALVSAGLWWVWKPGALIAPGAILLWLFLPARASFLVRPTPPDEQARRKR